MSIWRPLSFKVKSDRTHPVVLLHVSQFHPQSTIIAGCHLSMCEPPRRLHSRVTLQSTHTDPLSPSIVSIAMSNCDCGPIGLQKLGREVGGERGVGQSARRTEGWLWLFSLLFRQLINGVVPVSVSFSWFVETVAQFFSVPVSRLVPLFHLRASGGSQVTQVSLHCS